MTPAAPDDVHLRRLRWRCRRGMRELDVLLMKFLDLQYAQSTPAQQRAFEHLLTLQDPEIQALLAGRLTTDDTALHELVQRLLDHSDPAL